MGMSQLFILNKLVIDVKHRGITYLLNRVCDRIFNFLFVALCLLASISDLFLCLHHQGIYIFVTPSLSLGGEMNNQKTESFQNQWWS